MSYGHIKSKVCIGKKWKELGIKMFYKLLFSIQQGKQAFRILATS